MPLPLAVPIAFAAAGSLVRAAGSLQEGKANAFALQEEARSKRIQAKEVERRAAINAMDIVKKGNEFQAVQTSQYAFAGVDVSQGSPLLLLEDTVSKINDQVRFSNEEAAFSALQLKRSAAADEVSAGMSKKAGKLGAFSSILSGGGAIANLF